MDMGTRAALTTITNMEVENTRNEKPRNMNNKENVMENVFKQKVQAETFEERGHEEEPVEMEIPFHVISLASIDTDMPISPPDDFFNEYFEEIDIYYYQSEMVHPVRDNYLKESLLTSKMRTLLIDWLVEVHVQFDLLQETLFLTINIMDRFLQEEAYRTSKDQLQLVGVTAMLIASKVEEVYIPDLSDFVTITDYTYTKQEMKEMEMKILSTINFNLTTPLSLSFLLLSNPSSNNQLVGLLSQYILELSLLDYALVSLPPSLVAASSLHLSRQLLESSSPTPSQDKGNHYTEDQLMPVVQRMATGLLDSETHKLLAVRNKYSALKFQHRVTHLEEISENVLWEFLQLLDGNLC